MTVTSVELLSQRTAAAVAAYSDLVLAADTDDLRSALSSISGAARFTGTQADAFVVQYQLVHQLPNVLGNGFSATVFRDRLNDKHVIAIRGTELSGVQLIVDLFAADGLGIGGAGFANSQAVELFRYYKRLTTAGGQAVQYTAQEQWQLFAIKNSLLANLAPFVPVLTPVLAADFAAFRQQLALDTGVPVPAGSANPSVLSPSESVDVTGHSLGGHLAILFARFFPNQTDQVVTLNPPGFFERGDNALTALGFARPDDNKIIRIEADGDGVSEIGTIWPGFTLRIAQENEPGALAPFSQNHERANGNDSLALMTLLAELDQRFANDAAGLSALLRGASNLTTETYERTLDAVRRVLLGQNTSGTTVSTGPSDPNRKDLYSNFKALKEAEVFKALAGKVRLELASAGLGSQARSDFGASLALQTLSPIVLGASSGNETQVETELASANRIEYTAWLADKALSTAQRAFGQASYSDAWLADRTSMLETLVLRNQQDLADAVSVGGGRTAVQYRDVTQGIAVQIGLSNPLGDKRQVLFGGDLADPMNGKSLADDLYGGAGNDTLAGLDGADYLEGNSGDDVLAGGRGNDVLVGGAGNDRFVVGLNHGFDRVIGADADDRIELDGRIVTGAGRWRSRVGSVTVWIDDTNAGQAVRYVHDASRQTLIVSGAGSAVQVFDFQSGDLGIVVPTAPVVAPPAPDTPRFDLAIDEDRTRWDSARVSDGNSAVRVVNAYGLTFGSVISGAGDDVIAGGASAPMRQTLVSGGAGADRIYAGDERPLDDAIAAGEVDTGSRRGVVTLAGDTGDDEIVAGEGADVIFGGEGSDTLVAGAGDDIIFADGNNVGALTTLGFNNDPSTGEATWVFGRNDPRAAEPMRLNLALHLARRGLTVSDALGQRTEVFESLVATLNPLSDIDLSGLLDMSRDAVGPAAGDVHVFAQGSQRSYRDLTGGGYFGSNVGSGNDVIHAGAGDDVVNAGAGDDIVFAGIGSDMVSGYDGNDQIDGGDGNDRIYGDHAASVGTGVEATETRNVFDATYTVRNTLDASRHGSDRLTGGAGNDIVIGGGADDDVDGGDGDDILYGDDIGIDELFAGDDRVDGGAGNDAMYGGAGIDDLIGGTGDDKLYGERGDDRLSGGDGADLLAGDEGDDELDGGAGRDALFGGDGNDILVSDGDDLLDGGAGDDAYLLSLRPLRNSAGTFDVSSIVQDASGLSTLVLQDGPPAIAEFSVVNRAGQVLLLAGTSGAVQLGDALDFALTEVVTSAGERATLAELVAHDDAAAVDSGAGAGEGGSGAGGRGSGSAGESGAVGGVIRSVEADSRGVLQSTALLATNQTLWGSARADRLDGGAGSDALDGGRGNDWLVAGDGADDLTGGSGSDLLVGGKGSDTLRGGDRNGDSAVGDSDTYVFNLGDGVDSIVAKRSDAPATDVIRFGAGITRADLRIGFSPAANSSDTPLVDIRYSALDKIELAFGADLQIARVEFADGASVSWSDLVTSAQPTSTDGDDRLDGTRFDDLLSGGAGNDTIDGRAGDDVLAGGAGDDVLTGGSGLNAYAFGADSGRDLIRTTSGETGVLRFEATQSALRASLIAADLVIADGAGSEVRVLGYGDDASIGATWQLQAAGSTVGLGAWLGSTAPVYGGGSAARRQAFLDQQFADLRSASQYYPGFNVNGGSGAAVAAAVQRTTAQVIAGEAFVHDDYLLRSTRTETVRQIERRPVYSQVRTVKAGAPGGSITLYAVRADGTVGEDASSGFGGSWGRGPVTPIFGPNGQQVGYATLPTAPVTVTENRIVGWTSAVIEDRQTRTADVARQTTLTGTSGADRINGQGLFRGQIDTGAGDDVIELRSAPIGPYESWEYGRSDWGPLRREQQLRFENAPYQPHGLGAWIDAGSGDDRVLGTDGSDVIVGGTGKDWLDGQAGADTYLIADDGDIDRIADLAAFDWGGAEGREQFYEIYGGDLSNPNRDVVEFDASVSVDRLSYRWDMVISNGTWVRMLKLSHGGREFLDIDYPVAEALTDRSVSHGGVELFRFADGSTLTTQAFLARLDSLAAGESSGSGSGSGAGAGGGSGGTTGSGGGAGAGGSGGTGADSSTTTPAGDVTPPLPIYRLGDGRRNVGADTGTDTLRFGAGITIDRLAIRPATSGASTFISVLGDNGNESAGQGIDLHPASGIRQVALGDGSVMSLDALRITTRTLPGTRRDDLLRGDRRDDTVRGDRGTDMIFGRSGHDTLDGGDGNDLLAGEGGDDRLLGGKGVDVLIGGAGSDRIESGAGGGVIAFNRGDGADTVVCSARDRTALSVGGGIRYDDIRLQRSGGDLVLDFGAGDRMTIADWYRSRNARGLTTLQVVTAASSDFDTTSTSRLHQRPVVGFDFMALVRRFDAARLRDPALTSWAVADSLGAVWKKPAGTGTALGGEFAYRYATTRQAEPTDAAALRRPLAALSASGGQPAAPLRVVDPWQAMQASLAASTSSVGAMSSPANVAPQAPFGGLSWGALLAGSSTTATASRRINEETA